MSNIEKSKETSVVETVTQRVNQLQELGQLNLPNDYSASNAVRAAWLYLQEKPELINKSTRISQVNSIFKMVISGLSVVKSQGAFILYGDKLHWQEEYHGKKLLAKRFCGVSEVNHQCVYEGDDFTYIIDKKGRKQIENHIPKAENIDINKIRYAYAIAVFNDGTTQAEVMTITQIKQSWLMGATKGQSKAHTGFTDAMAEKTVASRLLSRLINASDDAAIFSNVHADESDDNLKAPKINTDNIKEVSFDEVEVIENTEAKEEERVKEVQQKKEKPPVEQVKKKENKSNDLFDQDEPF
jgi:recombination protein RecT